MSRNNPIPAADLASADLSGVNLTSGPNLTRANLDTSATAGIPLAVPIAPPMALNEYEHAA